VNLQAFGTPLEDAERRDLTINALFYNLRTQQIEDQTSRGLSDLGLSPPNPKRIRTPLEPFQTFKDDPLRIVRAVRFAARFGRDFELDEEMVRAIEREEIRVRSQSSHSQDTSFRFQELIPFSPLLASPAGPKED